MKLQMKKRSRTPGWILALGLGATGLGALGLEGLVEVASARSPRGPRRVRVVHKFNVAPPRNQLLFEAGLAVPLGDLKQPFYGTDQGLGQGNGYELGVRYRYFVEPWLAISPVFHYVRFGAESGAPPNSDLQYFEVQGSVYRYGLEVQSFVGSADASVRPYFTLGVSASYNKYRDEQVDGYGDRSYYEHATTALAVVGGLGLQFGPVEVSAVYHLNRFESNDLPTLSGADQWDWDHVTVRAGLSLGSF